MRLTFLGTGTSVGVPVIGCGCKVCRSNDEHDRRLRCSALIETETTRILIDCGPDFRQQMLGVPFRKIDALLLTHIHYDHTGGLDDLRPYCCFGQIDVYADNNTVQGLMKTIPYCFEEKRYPGVPDISLHVIHPHERMRFGDITVMPVQLFHGNMPILGFRIGDLAYITDMKTMDDSELELIKGVRVLVVNALRFAPEHHSHQNVSDAIKFAKRVGADRTFFIHCNHDIGLHSEVNASLPHGMALAYDGQTVDI